MTCDHASTHPDNCSSFTKKYIAIRMQSHQKGRVSLVEAVQRVFQALDSDPYLNPVFFGQLLTQLCIYELDAYRDELKAKESKKLLPKNGYFERALQTCHTKVPFWIPRIRGEAFLPSFLKKQQRCTDSFLEKMKELQVGGMSLADISTYESKRNGCTIAASTLSQRLNAYDFPQLITWNRRSLKSTRYRALHADATYLFARDQHKKSALYVVLGEREDGVYEMIHLSVREAESKTTWCKVFIDIQHRGLQSVPIITSDEHKGLVAAIRECFPDSDRQRCLMHFMKNMHQHFRKQDCLSEEDWQLLKAQLYKQVWEASSQQEALAGVNFLCQMYGIIAPRTMKTLARGCKDATAYLRHPHPIRRRTNNKLERWNGEVKRLAKKIRSFPNRKAAFRLAALLARCFNTKESRRPCCSQVAMA